MLYHIFKDVLKGRSVDATEKYLSARHIQRNPNIPSGHVGLEKMLSMVKPKPASERLSAYVVSVVAEGDYVVVSIVQPLPDPRSPGKSYTTTHFDMWRIQDGKADEHWDEARLGPPPSATPSSQ